MKKCVYCGDVVESYRPRGSHICEGCFLDRVIEMEGEEDGAKNKDN